MNTPLIEIALTEVYGERCREPEPGCPFCNAWHELDTLKARIPELEKDESRIDRLNELVPDDGEIRIIGEDGGIWLTDSSGCGLCEPMNSIREAIDESIQPK